VLKRDSFTLGRIFVEVETGKGSDALERRPHGDPDLDDALI
jgi:hypothetical protein